jgi:hypothetical protein
MPQNHTLAQNCDQNKMQLQEELKMRATFELHAPPRGAEPAPPVRARAAAN